MSEIWHTTLPSVETVTTVEPGRYRHFKGNFYSVIGMTQHSEDKDPDGEPARLVLYRRELDGSLWSRPLAMWSESVPAAKLAVNGVAPKADGAPTLRFEKCE